jgi:hypothetical protein
MVRRLIEDLVGSKENEEIIADKPTDRYLTGILFPPRTGIGPEDDDDADTANDEETDGGGEAIPASNALRPSTAGLSFAVQPEPGSYPVVTIQISCARYVGADETDEDDERSKSSRKIPRKWRRVPAFATLAEQIICLEPDAGYRPDIDLSEHGLPGLSLHVRASAWADAALVTVALSNIRELPEPFSRRTAEEACWFQVHMEVTAACGSKLLARPLRSTEADDDGRSAALIYRGATEYAVGHTCSAEWDAGSGAVTKIWTSWLPEAWVASTSADGDAIFAPLKYSGTATPFSARWLTEAEGDTLASGLTGVTDAYASWITREEACVQDLPEALREQARYHIVRCREALQRMEAGVSAIRADADVRVAFRLANRAMQIQRMWAEHKELEWRPFQLAFCLLTLASTADPVSADRGVMDLLWFPTGGGKTEAYLLLTAFTIFRRRLRVGTDGPGVTVLMRYTLRLLTVQQYQRAAALICACELVRLGGQGPSPKVLLDGPPISLGLWVGGESSPNTVKEAISALSSGAPSTPAQIKECPCCHCALDWKASPGKDEIWAVCSNKICDVARSGSHLPVWTVDEDVYRELPSLLIGTADKFAQIVRKSETGRLFGIGTPYAPPDLIIQDELHLISGPLGTMAGLYEVAVDGLCSRLGTRPKVIGSTATIRRAEQQIAALFDRQAFQFPPPGLNHDNSGFAVTDLSAPGRLYVGVTTAGRSAKFTLQAVCASLMQSASDPTLTPQERNPYWTLVTYFNSLRELGGALVLMQDDVVKSIKDFSNRHGEQPREIGGQTELTSRVPSSSIPEVLRLLARNADEPEAIDVTLASNMISVGVDIPRLGLMVVNGQPKGIAEYIQATSRVGRGRVAGLVISVYNANKARDRSHYETFKTWHQCLYREVEATSVTPFAPRARDRALHAPLVALARHLVPGLSGPPVDAASFEHEIRNIAEKIARRASRVDGDEEKSVRRQLDRLIEHWLDRGPLPRWWDDYRENGGLMISAEKAAELQARRIGKGLAWPTPNSLRSVEASVEFVLRNALKAVEPEDDEDE